jgi:hypothetical protein
MQRLKVLLIGTGLLFAAPAFAQVGGDASGAGGGSAAPAGGDATAAGGATTPSVGATVEGGGGAWSEEIIDNPVTLPKGALSVYGDLGILRLSITIPAVPPAPAMTQTFTLEQLVVGANYGVSDKLTVGGQYGIPLHDDSGTFPNSGKGPLTLLGAFNLKTDLKMSVAAAADLTINLGNTTTETIHAGLALRYNVAPKFAVFTGSPVAGMGPMAQHLSIGLNSNAPITFALPVGAAFQASPKLFAFADTTLASFSISNSNNAFIFSDFIPIEVGAFFRAVKDLDVGVIFNDDLKNAGDAYVISFAARFVKH